MNRTYSKILHTPVGLIILIGSIDGKNFKLKRVLGVNSAFAITLNNFKDEIRKLDLLIPADLPEKLMNCNSDDRLAAIIKNCFIENNILFDDSIIELMNIGRKIEDYFNDKSQIHIELNMLELDSLTEFQQKVLKTLTKISFGETVSYSQLAKMAKHPNAQRAVGTVMSKNPFPLLIPCHRVIRSDGKIGEFALGTEMKIKLLEHEEVKYK